MIRKILQLFFLSLAVVFLSGCAISRNNDKPFWDVIQHFERNGVHVDSVNPLDISHVKAVRAYAFTIGERQVGVYKYDSNNKKHKERLLRVDETGVFYVIGRRYRAMRNGSYILIDYETHPQKDAIIKAFETF